MSFTKPLFAAAVAACVSSAACAQGSGEDLDEGTGALGVADIQASIETAWAKAEDANFVTARPVPHGAIYDDLETAFGRDARGRDQLRSAFWTPSKGAAPTYVDGKTFIVIQAPANADECAALGVLGARDVIVTTIYEEEGARVHGWFAVHPSAERHPPMAANVSWDRLVPSLDRLVLKACKASTASAYAK